MISVSTIQKHIDTWTFWVWKSGQKLSEYALKQVSGGTK